MDFEELFMFSSPFCECQSEVWVGQGVFLRGVYRPEGLTFWESFVLMVSDKRSVWEEVSCLDLNRADM
jgi:hypothetical protein